MTLQKIYLQKSFDVPVSTHKRKISVLIFEKRAAVASCRGQLTREEIRPAVEYRFSKLFRA
jgi:hypothetical protein